jgi:DNA polymerase III delta prime subunit
MALSNLWVETHRPKTLDEVIFASDDEKQIFKSMVERQSLPNLLLVGHQGTGKTTVSAALCHDLKVLPEDVLKVNCSDEKIDAIRDKVKVFAYTMPMGEFKVVRLEEMDYLSLDAQALLRSLMEEVSGFCRFIATANYSNKLMPAIRSRFTHEHVFVAPHRHRVLVRLCEILAAHDIDADIDDVEKVISASYPDMRKSIQILESCSSTGVLVLSTAKSASDWKLQLLPLLEKSDLKTARKLVCESATREEMEDIFSFLYQNVHRVKTLKGKEDQAVVLIAEYSYKHAFVADTELNVAAMFAELMQIAN